MWNKYAYVTPKQLWKIRAIGECAQKLSVFHCQLTLLFDIELVSGFGKSNYSDLTFVIIALSTSHAYLMYWMLLVIAMQNRPKTF